MSLLIVLKVYIPVDCKQPLLLLTLMDSNSNWSVSMSCSPSCTGVDEEGCM